jgi:hypothetical protein
VEAHFLGTQVRLIRRADGLPAPHSSTGEPHVEAMRFVVASGAIQARTGRRPAELAAPDGQRLVREAGALEVLDQGGDVPVRPRRTRRTRASAHGARLFARMALSDTSADL